MGDVVKIFPHGAAMDPDEVLERAKGQMQNVLVIGYDQDGSLDVRADLGLSRREMIWMVDNFKHKLLSGDYGDSEQ